MMGQRTLLPDAAEVILDRLQVQGCERIIMVLRPARERSCCPACHRRSDRIHSWYRRRLRDLPWEGIPVRIELRVRRFFCDSDGCPQRIFTEQLSQTAPRYARRTSRLSLALEQITLALGGSAGSRLAGQLGILASGSTLLRQLRCLTVDESASPRVLGIDDWAWRKGRRYGTILCDLERGKVIDLLPERSSESAEQWLRTHPGAEIVSRDRASLYAEAVSKAAPQAVQVADRWHLLHNMREALVDALRPHHRLLTEVARAVTKGAKAATEAPGQQEASPEIPPFITARAQQQNRDRRLARYEAVMELVQPGVSQREIARRCEMSRKTLRGWIKAQTFPERKQGHHFSTVDPYNEYLGMRREQGCRNGAQLWRELRAQGFTGRPRTVRDWLRKHDGSQSSTGGQQSSAPVPPRRTPRQVAWLLLKNPADARPYLDELCRQSAEIAAASSAAREFCRMVRERDSAAWPSWRQTAISGPLAGFAKRLCHDEAAFLAALHLPWSNGPVEGHIHRLKLIKRSMYGRASFDLLRLRVVNAA
jgi:transposase